VFWRQFDIGEALVAARGHDTITELEPLLMRDDRHVRVNVAFVLGQLGDPRGFETIAAVLADRSERSHGQGIPGGNWSLRAQIQADRYYAARALGALKDRRGVELLVSLLNDKDVDYIVPWSLGEIGDERSIGPLMKKLEEDHPSSRVLAIYALEKLNARDALPKLRTLLEDRRKSNFGELVTVAEAARHAIAVITGSGASNIRERGSAHASR
jgi:HEAT repeat protein